MNTLKTNIEKLMSKDAEYYLNNMDKIGKYLYKILDYDFTNLNDNDLSNLGEIICRMVFINVNNYDKNLFNLTEPIIFSKEKDNYDIISGNKKIELKNRRKGMDDTVITGERGALLKEYKWRTYRNTLDEFEYIYVNFFEDNIWLWNLNNIQDKLDRNLFNKAFANIPSSNKVNNENTNFLRLFTIWGYSKDYDIKFKKELEYLYYLTFKIELKKCKDNSLKFTNTYKEYENFLKSNFTV